MDRLTDQDILAIQIEIDAVKDRLRAQRLHLALPQKVARQEEAIEGLCCVIQLLLEKLAYDPYQE